MCGVPEKSAQVEGWVGMVLLSRGKEGKEVVEEWVRGEGSGVVRKGLEGEDGDEGKGKGKGTRENIWLLLGILNIPTDFATRTLTAESLEGDNS